KNGDISTDATGDVKNFTWAQPTVLQDGVVALGVSVDYDKAEIKTQIAGTLDAAGGTPNSFGAGPGGQANYAANTISVPDHRFEDGQAVTYTNGRAPNVGGLEDGQTYYVQFVDSDTVRLAKARTLALNYVRPPEYDSSTVVHQTLGKLAKLDFDASGVNLSTSTITFRNPHGLKDGQAVTYYGTASAPDANGVEQNSGVEPLFQGKTYYVKKVSDTAIQLSATKDGGAITLTSAGVGTHSLLYQDQASTNTFDPEQDVDNEANTIKFASPHGFQTGDAV